MSRVRFIEHAKRADEAYQRFIRWQNEVDKLEALAMHNGKTEWEAAISMKNRPDYAIALANRNVWLQRAAMEQGMAQLHRVWD